MKNHLCALIELARQLFDWNLKNFGDKKLYMSEIIDNIELIICRNDKRAIVIDERVIP